MNYNLGETDCKNWLIEEDIFDRNSLGKCETIMALGNGYMGSRSATEESYQGEVRDTFIAGTFNRFDANEVSELPNCADVIGIKIVIDGELFDLTHGVIQNYSRVLNLKNGELARRITWTNVKGKTFVLSFRRFISLDDLHLTGHQIEITCLNGIADIAVHSGINGQMTNSGVQHFSEGEKRLFNGQILQMIQHTTESNIDIVINSIHRFYMGSRKYEPQSIIMMDRRKIFIEYDIQLEPNVPVIIEKLSYYATSRDKDFRLMDLHMLGMDCVDRLEANIEFGYEILLQKSESTWNEQVWNVCPILIESDDGSDQLAIRFAQYHLRIMTPYHDNKMSIGAKGLTGEGYKGHTFWDTEVFILPYYSFNHPEIARRLLEYRFYSLEGAHRKAAQNGYEGAMFPWESAWLTDGEVTPIYGAADIVSGESMKIWSGFIEQHITSDISFAAWQYFQITGDQDFMDQYGYELILDAAKFWNSRLEYWKEDQLFHITDVVGPDEYKEHVDDNAFTNYMAAYNISLAINCYLILKKDKPELWKKLNQKLDLDRVNKQWNERVSAIYLPLPNNMNVIPQDRTYLNKQKIDLAPYKNQEHVGSLFREYNLEQVNEIQVSKQADVLMLIYLLESQFSNDVKRACWDYYEPKTLHDSSLSLSTHSILASDLGNYDLAYKLFENAAMIDLGSNMKSSDHGIHAASLGGIWQCIINGFGGMRLINGKLRIEPHLPVKWKSLYFEFNWKGECLKVQINQEEMVIRKKYSESLTMITCYGQTYLFNEEVRIPIIASREE